MDNLLGMQGLTSVKKRLDHVLYELDSLGTEPDEKKANNVAAELSVIKSQYKDSQQVPMCCFRYDTQSRIICDTTGPLSQKQFMEKCRQCQSEIKTVLTSLRTD